MKECMYVRARARVCVCVYVYIYRFLATLEAAIFLTLFYYNPNYIELFTACFVLVA